MYGSACFVACSAGSGACVGQNLLWREQQVDQDLYSTVLLLAVWTAAAGLGKGIRITLVAALCCLCSSYCWQRSTVAG
jgi:hypothetical protein